MFIPPNVPENYRKWAVCCDAIRRYSPKRDLYAAGRAADYSDLGAVKCCRRQEFLLYCRKKMHKLERKIARYSALRDKLAPELDNPEKYLLETSDLLNLVGNVIKISRRNESKSFYLALSECSGDGKTVSGKNSGNDFDALELMSLGYGKEIR